MKTTLNNFLNKQGLIKLPKLIDFVSLWIEKYYEREEDMQYYLGFLKQKPERWMFVPCGKDGKPLEKPKMFDVWVKDHGGKWSPKYKVKCIEYQQACDRVLFEGSGIIEQSNQQEFHIMSKSIILIFTDEKCVDLDGNKYNSLNDLLNADVELYVKPEKL